MEMTPIRYHVVPRADILYSFPIPDGTIRDYESLRPDVLQDATQDIFSPNSRSTRQRWTRFDLFERVEQPDDADFILCQNWMELAMQAGERHLIPNMLAYLEGYTAKKACLISWNHDVDSGTMPEFQSLPENFFVLNYNTSSPKPHDVLLPFWNVETRQTWEPQTDRIFRGGFMGFIGGVQVRKRMYDAFRGREGWFINDTTGAKQSQSVYLEYMKEFDFALCPRGGGLSSYRFFESLMSGCVPILFADDVALPYQDLDWGSLIVRLPERDAGNFEIVSEILAHIDAKKRRHRIAEVRERFGLAGVQLEVARRISEHLS